MSVLVSIIICTCNRAKHLRKTLAAMESVALPLGWKAELIVVDNASTDDTAQVTAQSVPSNKTILYFHEPKRGQCHARNLGLKESNGDIVVFTDDDIRPSRQWFESLCAPIVSGAAKAVVGSITIAPHLVRPGSLAGQWIRLASTEEIDTVKPDLIGANMAFCRSILAHVPRFDTELGPGALGFGDDTLFGRQLRAAGFSVSYAPDAWVEHHFEPARLTRPSLVAMAQKQGRSAAYLAYHWHHQEEKEALLFLAKRSLRLACLRQARREQIKRCAEAPAWELNILRDIAYYTQYMKEYRRPRNYEKYGLITRRPQE